MSVSPAPPPVIFAAVRDHKVSTCVKFRVHGAHTIVKYLLIAGIRLTFAEMPSVPLQGSELPLPIEYAGQRAETLSISHFSRLF